MADPRFLMVSMHLSAAVFAVVFQPFLFGDQPPFIEGAMPTLNILDVLKGPF
jgi:hypothetical protein